MRYCILLFATTSLTVVGSFDTPELAKAHATDPANADTFGTEYPDYPADAPLNSLSGWAVTSIIEPGEPIETAAALDTQENKSSDVAQNENEQVNQPAGGAATA